MNNKIARSALALSLLIAAGNIDAATTDVAPVQGTTTDISSTPLLVSSTGSGTPVQPNIMFVLDDSGSMDWNYLPDWANDNNPPDEIFKNNGFNGVAYNAAITYLIPIDYNANTATITVGGTTTVNTVVSGITVSSQQIMAAASVGSKTTSVVAANIAAQINLCTAAITGNCTISGYSASAAGSTVTIVAPSAGTTSTPAVTRSAGSLTFSATAFSGSSGSATKLSMTGQSASTGGDATATATLPNWRAVPNDGFGIQSTSKSNLEGSATFYTFVGGEYCDTPALRNCQATQDTAHPYLAQLRWCTSSTLTTCQATWTSAYTFPRYAGKRTAATTTITFNTATTASQISSIKVNGVQILSGTVPGTATKNGGTMATAVANGINACTTAISGACGTTGYSASASGRVVTITAPIAAGNISYTPVVTVSTGNMTASTVAFSGYASVPGQDIQTNIVSTNNSYAYPGTTAKAPSRTDCAGTTCTYKEEMTNYANWWAYYHTRMQMMKSSASISFSALGKSYRVGYMSINNNTGSDFYNPVTFDGTNKAGWYTKLFNAKPNNSTPLRIALATVGQLYAGKLDGNTLNGSTVNEPLQYSCQQNYTILSTDGYWNESSTPTRINKTTAIGNTDGTDVRPYYDGALLQFTKTTAQTLMDQSQVQQSTSQLQSRTQQLQSQTSTLQSQTTQLQQKTSNLQSQTSQLQERDSSLQSQTSQLQGKYSYLQSQTSQLQAMISNLQSQTSQLQERDSYLQSQTSQLQERDSSLQSQTSQQQKRTSQLQQQTSQLQQQTSQLQSQTSQLQEMISNLQSQTSQLQAKYSYLQSQTSQLQSQSSQLQSQTSQLQESHSDLESSTMYLQENDSTNAGVTWTGWYDVASCTWSTSGGSQTQCRYVTAAGGSTAWDAVSATWTGPVGSCTTSFGTGTSGTWSTGTSCQYMAPTAWANTSSCTVHNPDAGPSYTTAVQCQYTPWTAWANAPSCTPLAQSTGPSYTVGTATQCQYTPWSPWSGTSSCTAVAQDTTNYTVGTATQCQTVVTSPFANSAAPCSATTTPDASGYTTQCQYTPWAGPFGVSSCTPAAQDPATVATATQCQTVITSPFANAASCNATTTPDPTGFTTQCQYTPWAGPYGVSSCTPTAQSTGPNYTVGTAYQCATVVTSAYASVSSCTDTTGSPDATGFTTQCQYAPWTAWANASSCTAVAQSTGPNYTVGTASQCQYAPWSAWTNVSSCTTLAQSTGPNYTVGTASQCQYAPWSAWAGAQTCSAVAQSTGPSYTVGTAAECQTVVTSPFANAGACAVSTTPDASGYTTQCQYAPWTAWTGVPSCTAAAQSTSPNYTVGTAKQCQTVITSAYANAASCNATSTPDASGYTTQCQYTPYDGPWGVSSCTPVSQSTGPNYTTGMAVQCATVVTSSFANAGSCTATTTPNATGFTTQCQYTPWAGPFGVSSCTPTAQSTGPTYTVGTAYQCATVVTSPYTNVSSCTATTTPTALGFTTQCQYTPWTGWAGTSSCTTANQSTGPSYSVGTATQCQTIVTSPFANASLCTATTTPNASGYTTQCQYTPWTAWAGVPSCTAAAQSSNPNYTVGTAKQCQTVITSAYANAASCNATSTPDASGYTTQCQYTPWTAWGGTPSCTATAQSTGPNYTVGTAYQCQSVITSPFANAASCNATTTPDASGYTTQCQYTPWTAWANYAGSTCPAVAQSTGPNYTVGTARNCQTLDTGWVGAASCTPTGSPAATYSIFDSTGKLVNCQTVTTTNVPVATCTAATASSSNAYTTTTCATVQISPPTGVSTCTADTANAGNSYITTNCNPVTTSTIVNTCTAQTASELNNWTTTTCSTPTIIGGGTSNTLADVAEYYYITDLRTATLGNCSGAGGTTLCTTPDPAVTGDLDKLNNVPKSGDDAASWQHMTTFTLGLGADGYMQYDPNYKAQTSGDYYDVKNNTVADPTHGICTWQTSGGCNWPTPSSNSQANIDDLWHAGVNGRGQYFSAKNPTSLSYSLSTALASVQARAGAAAAATTSNPNVSSGDNFLFSSTFVSIDWTGDLVRETLDPSTGQVVVDASNNPVVDWSAQANLDNMSYTSRNIYMADPNNLYNGGAGNQLKLFVYSNMTSTEQSYFKTPNIAPLTQFQGGANALSASDQTLAAGANLVNFLRGDRSNEGVLTDTTKYYRLRNHVLGDIVNAEAVYVKGSLLHYADPNYTAFATSTATRQGIVYAAANDGMLHAFYAADGMMDSTGHVVSSGGTTVIGGNEAWAFIPTQMLPNLYRLADKSYGTQHSYFVDGTPTAGDICPFAPSSTCAAGQWKTILVGGFNDGGHGYYALDITNPAAPKLLWEFSDPNMGLTYGNPEIGKLSNGTWVVLMTSGYNNVGDGVGHLYVVNAYTGALITSINGTGIISTNVGSTTTPSGLSRILAEVNNPDTDATIVQVYGGDLEGNLWRFDVNGNVGAPGYDAQLLAVLKGPTGLLQPITTKPQVGMINGLTMVYVGTGRYLGVGDLSATIPQAVATQTIYAIKDPLSTTTTPSVAIYNDPRSTGSFVQQVQTTISCPANTTGICTQGQLVRSSTSYPVDLTINAGWFVDMPDTGERDNTDPSLQLGTLALTTNVPSGDLCAVGGYSYSYFLDYRTGGPVTTSYIPVTTLGVTTNLNISSTKLGDSLGTRPVMLRLPGGSVVECVRMSDGTTYCGGVPVDKGIAPTRRVSWRELTTE